MESTFSFRKFPSSGNSGRATFYRRNQVFSRKFPFGENRIILSIYIRSEFCRFFSKWRTTSTTKTILKNTAYWWRNHLAVNIELPILMVDSKNCSFWRLYSILLSFHSLVYFNGPLCNSNWTEWSTIQGVIARVISKSDEREARGRFEITSTITPWIVRHEVQLLLQISELKMSFKNFFWAKTSVALFLSFENCRKHC